MKLHKSILVTGGAGYIGSHICKALALSGYNPVVFDNLVYGHQWAVKWGPLVVGDLINKELLVETIKKFKISAVIHLAAFAYVGESVVNPAKYYQNNVWGSLSLFEAMRECEVNRIVFSSTCATYGIPDKIPINENHPLKPINPYGASKCMVERVLSDYNKAYGIGSIFLRYFNAAGADPQGEIGEAHTPETHLIPLVLQTAIGNIPEFKIFGNKYQTKDGTCIRDYIHVMDLATAHVLSLEYLINKPTVDFFNLGTEGGTSVFQILKAAEDVIGKKINYSILENRPGDPPVLIADASKAKSVLGWKPKYGSITTILEHAWQWQNRLTLLK